MTEPTENWDLIRERQGFVLWQAEFPPDAQVRRKPTMLEWLIACGLLGGFAGVVLMFNIWSLGLGLLILGAALTAVACLFIIAAKKA